MNKIVVISMVKNEADIIESFVRHSLSFADEVLLADHSSSDKTMDILKELQAEGLPVEVKKLYQVELAHAEVMNDLLWEAIDEHGADIVLPMDADEFLVNTENHQSCRGILQQLDAAKLYRLEWKIYEPLHQHIGEDQFLLSRPCRRGYDMAAGQKVIVGCALAQKAPFKLVQGCHYAYWDTAQGREGVPWVKAPYLHTAHFHWRSNEQYASKTATSWLNNVTKYSLYTSTAGFLQPFYRQIQQGKRVEPGDLLQEAEEFDLRPYVEPQILCYSKDVRPDVLKNLMAASELIAEALVEEKVLKRQRFVSVIVPFLGDLKALGNSLRMLSKQRYPYLEIFVCALVPESREKLKAVCEQFAMQNFSLLLPKPDQDIFTQLEVSAKGTYVQWIFPGDILQPDKILRMTACLETQDMHYGMAFMTGSQDFVDWMPYLDIQLSEPAISVYRRKIWQMLLKEGKYPSGGMAAALIRRELMQNRHWLRGCFLGNKPLYMTMWRSVLQELPMEGEWQALAVLNELLMEKAWGKTSAADILWHQLEWYCLLDEDRACLTDEEYQAAIQRLRENGQSLLAMAEEQGIPMHTELWQQYKAMLEAAAG